MGVRAFFAGGGRRAFLGHAFRATRRFARHAAAGSAPSAAAGTCFLKNGRSFGRFVTEDGVRRRMLWENPAALFGFAPAQAN